MSHKYKYQKGNVLFYVLIAVVTFAALSYAVSNNVSDTTFTISEERAELAATEILTMARNIEQAVQRMRAKGISENDLCFDIDEYPGGNTMFEHSACATTSNRIFHADGGGVSYEAVSESALDSSDSANATFALWHPQSGYQLEGVGEETNADLILQVNFVLVGVCEAINDLLGVPNPSGEPPVETNDAASMGFTGSFGSGTVANTLNDDGTGLSGKTSYCRISSAGASKGQFNHVVLAR